MRSTAYLEAIMDIYRSGPFKKTGNKVNKPDGVILYHRILCSFKNQVLQNLGSELYPIYLAL